MGCAGGAGVKVCTSHAYRHRNWPPQKYSPVTSPTMPPYCCLHETKLRKKLVYVGVISCLIVFAGSYVEYRLYSHMIHMLESVTRILFMKIHTCTFLMYSLSTCRNHCVCWSGDINPVDLTVFLPWQTAETAETTSTTTKKSQMTFTQRR